MNLDAALQTFAEECRELLEQMEQLLLGLDPALVDRESLNAIFRAAHTIKGSAGLFGLDATVGFTHHVEELLDAVRNGTRKLSSEDVALLLRARDQIQTIVLTELQGGTPSAEVQQASTELLALLTGAPAITPTGNTPATPSTHASTGNPASTTQKTWFLCLRFGPDVIQDGMDPLNFIAYLDRLGSILGIVLLTDGLPSADKADPLRCYLGFGIVMQSDRPSAELEEVFDFVRDGSDITLLGNDAPPESFKDLIARLPGGDDPLALQQLLLKHGIGLQGGGPVASSPTLPSPLTQRDVAPATATTTTAATPASSKANEPAKPSAASEARFIRVDATKLDELIDMVGELIIASASAEIAAANIGGPLAESVSDLVQLIEGLRSSALSLRMVSIGPTFERFRRTVRDLSAELGKQIDLRIEGGETELDKVVVERIADPLMHLVRNALDHGIKDPAYRTARGKNPRGLLTLRAYYDAGNVVIEVADDGAGLPREKVLAKARAIGLVGEHAELSDHEIDQLIFAPGFSTADQISNISGRGVGMDVVKRNIDSLRGDIQLFSTPGVGTTVRIRLPLSLAIIDGFLISAGATRFVIPLEMIVECLEMTDELRRTALLRGSINLRGDAVACVWMTSVFGLASVPGQRENVVVVQMGRQRLGLVVGALHGETQAVIKPLGAVFNGLQGVVGASIHGNGEVAFVLDVPGVIRLLGQHAGLGMAAVA